MDTGTGFTAAVANECGTASKGVGGQFSWKPTNAGKRLISTTIRRVRTKPFVIGHGAAWLSLGTANPANQNESADHAVCKATAQKEEHG
jgi:hypothetical protein